ncbi:MAG: hypothetical protein K2N63_06845 [Lachnospiraceae bacterium]|nr:hypothetical protein [Lachnospiraceae bacterium]
MLIYFNGQQERKAPVMDNGTGEMSAKMYMDDNGKIIPSGNCKAWWLADGISD